METEDISDILANLFLENELSFIIKSFYTAKRNEAIIVNNFVYHRKTSKATGDGDVSRWVCNVKNCSASLTSDNTDIVKINGSLLKLVQTGLLIFALTFLNNFIL